MKYSEIYQANLKDYKPLHWKKRPVYTRYRYLQDYLSEEIGEQVAQVLAFPSIKDNYAGWLSDIIDPSQAVELPLLDKESYREAKRKMDELLGQVQAHIQQLQTSPRRSDVETSYLLEEAFKVPNENHILVDPHSKRFCFVAWGFDLTEEAKGAIPVAPIPIVEKENTIPPKEEIPAPIEQEENIISLEKPPKEPAISPLEENIVQAAPLSEIPALDEESVIPEKKQEAPLTEEKEVDKPPRKFPWLFWLLPLLLLGLLAFLIFYFMRENHLPEKPDIHPPIDSSYIGYDAESPLKKEIITNQLLVFLTNPKALESFARKFKQAYPEPSIKIVYFSSDNDRLKIEFPPERRLEIMENLEKNFSEVEFVMDEGIFGANQLQSFNDPGFKDKKMHWYLDKVKAQEAWKTTKGKEDIIIAIIDNGFDLSHPEFKGRIVSPRNVPKNNDKPDTGFLGMLHGTHVAATAAGNLNNAEGTAGLAPDCKIMPIQVGNSFGIMTTSAIVDGIYYAKKNGAKVINLSLGMNYGANFKRMSRQEQQRIADTQFLKEAAFWSDLFEKLFKDDIGIVQAAGNENVLVWIDPMKRNPYSVKVTATGSDDKKASFSNHGEGSTLSAPGTKIYSAIPNGEYDYLDGTSMASPLVSAAVALLLSNKKELTPQDCIRHLYDTGIVLSPDIGPLIQVDKALVE